MVDMVDVDGDGTVAFYEFYQMCKEKDPSLPLWRPREEKLYRKRDWFAEGGVRDLPPVGSAAAAGKEFLALDAKKAVEAQRASEARAEEIKRKTVKKLACEGAVAEAVSSSQTDASSTMKTSPTESEPLSPQTEPA